MSEIVNFFSLQIILLLAVILVHTYLGLHVIRRGIIFSDLALDQLAAFGVIVGIGLGFRGGSTTSYLFSLGAVLLGSFVLAFAKPKNQRIPHEAVIGITYGLALVASIMVADKFSGGSAYVTQTLSGCMLWVNWNLVIVTVLVYLVLSIFHYIYRKKFIAITDKSREVKHENLWDLLFFATLGIIAALIVPIAGVLLAYSFLMIPAAIAALFTKKWGEGLKIGWIVGLIASFSGVLASYFFRLPYGPTLVLTLGIFFLGALIVRALIPEKA